MTKPEARKNSQSPMINYGDDATILSLGFGILVISSDFWFGNWSLVEN